MEISKNDIDNISNSINREEDIENIIKIESGNLWAEDNYFNFINTMKSEGYEEEIEPQILHVYSNDYLLNIKSSKKILYYCNNNNYKHDDNYISWYTHNLVSKKNIDTLFDSNLIFLNIRKTLIDAEKKPVINWDNMRKYFKINKFITYTDKKTDIKYIVNIYKGHNRDYYEATDKEYHLSLNKSKIINKTQQYEFYIDITNTDNDNILPAIIKMEQALHLNSFIISKNQQLDVLDDYGKLVKADIITRSFDAKKPPLLTPKPFTLERINMLDPSEFNNGYGNTSILTEYTVTEKADGERLLMYINNNGSVYLINNSHQVIDTGLKSPNELYNSLLDGEYITCNKRRDNASVGLYASFDMYYYNGEKITQYPLISDKSDKSQSSQCRYNYLLKTEKLLKSKNEFAIEYIVKEHFYSKDILNDCKNILTNIIYPYEIDGLIFTPAKLAVYSNYANKPEPLTEKLAWNKVFKWKPPEQNSIDFLVKKGDIITIDTISYVEFKLYIGYNASQIDDYTIKDVFNYIYKYNQYKKEIKDRKKYEPRLFMPEYYYEKGIESSLIKLQTNKDTRCENGDKIEDDIIVEFNYDSSEANPSMRWKPMRVRDDKTRIYRQGILTKTLNDFSVACNVWSSIHNPISQSNIVGNERIVNNIDVAELSGNDIYYSRTIPRSARLSFHMLEFHNHGIKDLLYSKPSKKRSIVELACGQGGDLPRWIKYEYRFVLGVDLVKNNIYSPKHGAYSRLLKDKSEFIHNNGKNNNIQFPDMVFAVGDCSKSIITGECAINNEDPSRDDKDSYNLLKMVFGKGSKKNDTQFNKIIGRGNNGFDVCSCMFGIHYFFKNEEMLNGFLLNVSQLLNNGGVFLCTFMDGERIETDIENNGGDKIEGFKNLSARKEDRGEAIWAILRCYDKDETSKYNKKINVFIETTGKLVPEYVVSYRFLIEKCKEFGLNIKESEMFSETFNKFKSNLDELSKTKNNLYKAIIELDNDINIDLKRFSSFNRWCIFEKVE